MSDSDNNSEKEELIPFKVIKEEWNEYELDNTTIIKSKFVLMNIIKTPETNEKGQHLTVHQSQNLIAIFSPEEVRGDPDRNYGVDELEAHIIERNLFFRQILDSEFNEYETDNYLIKIKNTVKSIDLASKFDARGNPAYIVRSETQILSLEEDEEERTS